MVLVLVDFLTGRQESKTVLFKLKNLTGSLFSANKSLHDVFSNRIRLSTVTLIVYRVVLLKGC